MSDALSRAQLIEIVDRLQNPVNITEQEVDDLLQALTRSVPDPNVTDYIFWYETPQTAAEIVDHALSYRPR